MIKVKFPNTPARTKDAESLLQQLRLSNKANRVGITRALEDEDRRQGENYVLQTGIDRSLLGKPKHLVDEFGIQVHEARERGKKKPRFLNPTDKELAAHHRSGGNKES